MTKATTLSEATQWAVNKRKAEGIVFPPAKHHAAEYLSSVKMEVCGPCLQELTDENMWGECPGWNPE